MKIHIFLLTVAIATTVFILSCGLTGEVGGDGNGSTSSSSMASPNPSSSRVGGLSSGSAFAYGSLRYEGQIYKTIVIGNQTWMAENLNYNATNSRCYGDNPNNCTKYGRLYNWATAKTSCPTGWHLPSQVEWNIMTAYIGGASSEGKKLKATSGWNINGNGTDEYGFSALPGGYGNSDGSFGSIGDNGSWWSASELTSSGAYGRNMYYYSEDANWFGTIRSNLYSVRCIQE